MLQVQLWLRAIPQTNMQSPVVGIHFLLSVPLNRQLDTAIASFCYDTKQKVVVVLHHNSYSCKETKLYECMFEYLCVLIT